MTGLLTTLVLSLLPVTRKYYDQNVACSNIQHFDIALGSRDFARYVPQYVLCVHIATTTFDVTSNNQDSFGGKTVSPKALSWREDEEKTILHPVKGLAFSWRSMNQIQDRATVFIVSGKTLISF